MNSHISHRCFRLIALGVCVAYTSHVHSQVPGAAVSVDQDGTVHVPAQVVPPSRFLSDAGKQYLAEHLQNLGRPEMLAQGGVPPLIAGYVARQREIYDVTKEDTSIGGVHAYVYTPKAGITPRNKNRVLINLHGGGFSACWPGCAELESIPIAALARIRVVSLEYRQSPTYRFPAASEDVAAAYRELLKHYRAKNIGIYGCSAGGMLTGEAVAWFQQHNLPAPGAIGILCAGMTLDEDGFGGDATYTATPLGERRLQPPPATVNDKPKQSPLAYFQDANLHDPLISPAYHPEVLAKFPPTLIVTGTRAFELSSAVYTHAQLLKYGVTAELHVWEGMFHGFMYNPDVPESQDCYNEVVKFFDRQLAR